MRSLRGRLLTFRTNMIYIVKLLIMYSGWDKMRGGKRGSRMGDIADELLGRRGSARGSELKPYDYTPNILHFLVAEFA